MERQTTDGGEGNGLDLSALLGSLGQDGNGPDLSSLLELVKGTGKEGQEGPEQRQSPGGEGGMDLAALLGMLGGLGGIPGGGSAGEEKPTPPGRDGDGLPSFDPALFATFHRAMKAMREPDRNITLLEALRPFLEPERQKKADEAIKFLHLIKLAPLLQGLSPDGGG